MKHLTPPCNLKAQRSRTGMSVRLLSIIVVLAAVAVIVFSVFELRQTSLHADLLYELEQERLTCDKAIQQFMDGSDYLTSQVQQYVVNGDRAFMDNYWTEVNATRSRDSAVDEILRLNITPEEQRMATESKNGSDSLIQGEIWAMRIMSESLGIAEADMPEEVAACRLDDEHAALSAEDKQEAAVDYIFGPDYSFAKSGIRGNVNAFRNEISNRYGEETIAALQRTKVTTLYMVIGMGIFFLILAVALLCFARQVVTPLMGYSRVLAMHESDHPIALPVNGATEIRQFARAFNMLYAQVEQNTKRLARLGYVDFLTEVPNRASVTEYIEGAIAAGEQPLGLMIIDIDNFKRFNDCYGHALGDKVLKRVAQAVCSVQPAQSGVSGRICGEEFVVASRDASERSQRHIAETILHNVRRITADDVELPFIKDFHITVSIGGMIWRGEKPAGFIKLLSKADKALYLSKQTGKDRYTSYASFMD